MSTLKKFDLFNQHFEEEEEHKSNSTEYDFLWKPEDESKAKNDEKVKIPA